MERGVCRMTGQQAVELIQKEAWVGRKPGLSRTLELLHLLFNERKLHVKMYEKLYNPYVCSTK